VIRRSVIEWGSLPYGDGDDEIPEWAAVRLGSVARKSPLGGESGSRILTLGRNAMRVGQVVGIIAADGCTLEILPKIDVHPNADGDAERGLIRKRLVHLLAVALDMEIDGGTQTEIGWQEHSLLEILIRLFGTKLADAVRQGMPRRYMHCQDDLRALRGRLDVARQFTALAVNPSKLACNYDELSTDTALNQIMKAAISRLSRIAQTTGNQRRLAELAFSYADVSAVPVSALRWGDVQLDRTNARWKDLVGLAKFLLGDRFQTTSAGTQAGFSLLFEMNTLFEQYIGRMMRKALAETGLSVHLQGGRMFCLEAVDDGRRIFQTKPDILIKRGAECVHIIDTKWKRISSRIEDQKQGIAQSDVYQMMAYGQIYRCGELTLLYPHHHGLKNAPGRQSMHIVEGGSSRLMTTSVDLVDTRAIKALLRSLIISSGSDMAR
jgi:5-methylcytosine-specific restriction enzyme subunit McrC